MHIWTIEKWEKYYDLSNPKHRIGVRLRIDNGVDPEVRAACKKFLTWLRSKYFFPVRVPIYIKASETVKASDGEMVSAIFQPTHDEHGKHLEPYISVAAGDYYDILKRRGRDNALAAILCSIAHELTHYFQWINYLKLTKIGEERQAKAYVDFIIDDYKDYTEHP